jgi:hypothetical protein
MTFIYNSLYIKINDPEKKAVMLRKDYFPLQKEIT